MGVVVKLEEEVMVLVIVVADAVRADAASTTTIKGELLKILELIKIKRERRNNIIVKINFTR